MPHSISKIWIHAVWATKKRRPLITPDIESRVHNYLREQLLETGCPVRIVNGMPDHVHCLFLLNRERSVAGVIKQIKGSVSHFINQNDLITAKFAWQTGYAAFSVSDSQVSRVYRYILNQKQHHNQRSFGQEYDKFIQISGVMQGDSDAPPGRTGSSRPGT